LQLTSGGSPPSVMLEPTRNGSLGRINACLQNKDIATCQRSFSAKKPDF